MTTESCFPAARLRSPKLIDGGGLIRSISWALGLRQGEILGLRWPDVDLAAGTVRVRAALQRVDGRFALVEPKSTRSRRVVPLPAVVRTGLVAHRERAALEPSRHTEPPFDELVFTTTAGAPIDGINLTRRFQRILRRAGLPHQRFHDLRHGCASPLLAQGVPARVVMDRDGSLPVCLDGFSSFR